MTNRQLHLSPGSVVIFEGLDKAGKSTQIDLLKARTLSGEAVFAHMPSGSTAFTKGLYDLLENHPPSSGLGRQLAHLACHCENMPGLVEAATSRALVLDRWWWSTMAYGWYGGDVPAAGISGAVFRELIGRIWAPVTPSIIFLFLTPREEDPNNVDGVAEGYRQLADDHPGTVVLVPTMSESETHAHIVATLTSAGLTKTP